MAIVLLSYNSPYFGRTPTSATVAVGKHVYEYTEFDYGVFRQVLEENRFKHGKILNWLKKNAKHYTKLK